MTTQNINTGNTNRALVIGRQAGRDILNTTKSGESGDARLTFAFFLALQGQLTFTAVIPGKDGELGESTPFDLIAFGREPVKGDGKRDAAMVSARYRAISQDMLGLGEADNAVTQRIRRAYNMAIYIDAAIAKLEDAEAEQAMAIIDIVQRKRVRHGETIQIAFLTVPHFILYDYDDKTLKLNEQQRETCKRMRLFPAELDGANVVGVPVRASLRTVAARADVHAGRRAARQQQQDAGKSLTSAIVLLDKLTKQWSSESGEADVVLSSARRLDLFILQQRIATLLADDPLSDEELKAVNSRMAA